MEAIKKISEYVAQLRRVGKGHGITLKTNFIITVFTEVLILLNHLMKQGFQFLALLCTHVSYFLLFLHVFYLFYKINLLIKPHGFDGFSGVWHFDQMLLNEGVAA